jgi:effector-binding domain-containing protein
MLAGAARGLHPLAMRGPLLLCPLLVLACQSSKNSLPPGAVSLPDVPLSSAPFDVVHCAFKETLDQPYVFLELRGSYTATGPNLAEVAKRMSEQGVTASGPPFALFYDDPADVPIENLRSRIAFPVESVGSVRAPLQADVLRSSTVAYALVDGPYPEVPRCYPGLLAYVKKMHWALAGPIREIYHVAPGMVSDWSALRCEVQAPVSMAP